MATGPTPTTTPTPTTAPPAPPPPRPGDATTRAEMLPGGEVDARETRRQPGSDLERQLECRVRATGPSGRITVADVVPKADRR